jgi:hypothetical protein
VYHSALLLVFFSAGFYMLSKHVHTLYNNPVSNLVYSENFTLFSFIGTGDN